jgi:hypothetical protein
VVTGRPQYCPNYALDNWQDQYRQLLDELEETGRWVKKQTFFELIFDLWMANEMINAALSPSTEIFDKENMRPKGRGKYCYYRNPLQADEFMRKELNRRFPQAKSVILSNGFGQPISGLMNLVHPLAFHIVKYLITVLLLIGLNMVQDLADVGVFEFKNSGIIGLRDIFFR